MAITATISSDIMLVGIEDFLTAMVKDLRFTTHQSLHKGLGVAGVWVRSLFNNPRILLDIQAFEHFLEALEGLRSPK